MPLKTKSVKIIGILMILVLSIATPLQSFAAAPSLGNKKIYQLGVFPFLPARELEKIFAPFAASIGKALGKEVQFQSAKTYRDFISRTDAGQYDIVFVQPFDYINLADKNNYIPLATRKEMLSAIIVTKSGNPIENIQQLKGKIIAMPPAVAAVSRLSKNMFTKNGLNQGENISITHHRSHASCLQQVLINEAAACATAAPAIRFIENKMKVTFKQIAQTRSIPHTLFATNPMVSENQQKVIRDTILSWSTTEEGKKLLERGRMRPFRAISDIDYDIVRKINKTNPL